ncbi:hypothetical protein [uncultured Campylobacter sp.]|uniref:hypothetical protein n=1 Tax=uncultured Campylobacter sp. TaxID=218934 RepID=UPI0025DA2948|nr:hypothetical protein [uncultured Campylobacter sp.]
MRLFRHRASLFATASMAASSAERSHLRLPRMEFCSKPNPNLAVKYSRSICLCASFTFSFIRTFSGSKFHALMS